MARKPSKKSFQPVNELRKAFLGTEIEEDEDLMKEMAEIEAIAQQQQKEEKEARERARAAARAKDEAEAKAKAELARSMQEQKMKEMETERKRREESKARVEAAESPARKRREGNVPSPVVEEPTERKRDGKRTIVEADEEPAQRKRDGRKAGVEADEEPDRKKRDGKRTIVEADEEPAQRKRDGKRTIVEADEEPDRKKRDGKKTIVEADEEPDRKKRDGRKPGNEMGGKGEEGSTAGRRKGEKDGTSEKAGLDDGKRHRHDRTDDKPAPVEEPPPKPKPVPQGYIPDGPASEQYQTCFQLLADSLFSLIHSKHIRSKLAEQARTLAPLVIAGPAGCFDQLQLFQPKLPAPRFREYSEFVKAPISTSTNATELKSWVEQMESQMELLKADATTLLRYKDKDGAKNVTQYMTALKQSIDAVKLEPYVIPDLAFYRMIELNNDVPPGTLKISVKKLVGCHDLSDPLITVVKLPVQAMGDLTIKTKAAKPPDYEFDYQVTTGVLDLQGKAIFSRIQQEKGRLAVYSQRNPNAPLYVGEFQIARLIQKKSVNFVVKLDKPGAYVVLDISSHRAIAGAEMKEVQMPLVVAPSVLFKPSGTAQQKADAKPSGATQAQPSAAPSITEAATTPKPKPTPKKNVKLPVIYITTREEMQMKWSLDLMKLWVLRAEASISRHKAANVPVPDGVEQMYKHWNAEITRLEIDFNNGDMDAPTYKRQIRDAIEREKRRLDLFNGSDKEEHIGYMTVMASEMAEIPDD